MQRADVTAACCVAACILSTGALPSAHAVEAAQISLAEGWAHRARRLPVPSAAETIERLAPLREAVRVADLVDAVREGGAIPVPVADEHGRSLHSFRAAAAVAGSLFEPRPEARVLLWETRPAVLLAALPDGQVWGAAAGENMRFERLGTREEAAALVARHHGEGAPPAQCNVLKLFS